MNKGLILQYLVLILVPFLLYANTFRHQYALDDDIVIRQNQFTKQGLAGIDDIFANETFVGFFGKQKDLVAGGRYRPLSLATFALEIELFGERPAMSHVLNVLFYAITGLLILWSLRLMLLSSEKWRSWASVLPFLAALLWLVHPIHTEVVANIKGRDEILAMLFAMSSLGALMKFQDRGKAKWAVLGIGSMLLAMLSKENAFTFVLVIPLAIYFFRKVKVKEVLKPLALLSIPLVTVLIMRYLALGGMEVSGESVNELMNNPFVEANFAKKYATIFYTLGKYIELQIIPHTLTHDYYPYHISLKTFSNPYVLGSLILHVSMLGWAIVGIIRQKYLTAFALAFYLITLSVVSNLFFPVGTFMAERLVFMPSLGITVLMGWFIVKLATWISKSKTIPEDGELFNWFLKRNKLGFLVLIIAIVAYGFKTVDRNPVWKNNQTLFLTDVNISTNSAKMNNAAAGMLYDMWQSDTASNESKHQYLSRAKLYAERAVQIHPDYKPALQTLGNIYFFLDKDYDRAIAAYEQAGTNQAIENMLGIGQRAKNRGDLLGAEKCFAKYIQLKPHHTIGYLELADVYLKANKPDLAIQVLNDALGRFPNNGELLNKLGLVYGQGKQNFQLAIEYFRKALQAEPNNADAMENLGVAYGFTGENQLSLNYFRNALKLKGPDAQLYQNISSAYFRLGQLEEAKEFKIKAEELIRRKKR